MDDTSGFYKLDGSLLFGSNFVMNAAYELYREYYLSYSYPVDGWYWFDDESSARGFFGLPEPEVVADGSRSLTPYWS